MIKINKLLMRRLLLVNLLNCIFLVGCASSRFELADESPIPIWFEMPPGASRSDVTVTMEYYGSLFGSRRTAVVRLSDRKGRLIGEVSANLTGKEPLTLEPYSGSGPIPYPSYEVLTASGQREVVEHRRMEPVFHITRDPRVLGRLRLPD